MNFLNNLECLSLSGLYSQVYCLWVRPGAYPSEAPFRYSPLGQAASLAHKHYPRLEMLARVIHSSLLRKFVNYGRKKFYNFGTWAQCYKTFFARNLWIFIIS
jgi:hypothetical protein